MTARPPALDARLWRRFDGIMRISMSKPRLAAIVVLLLTACAGWESSTPAYAQPVVEEPTPSHYAPPPPVVDVPTDPAPEPADGPPGDRVAIASVHLLDDCPDPRAEPEMRERSAASKMRPPRYAGEAAEDSRRRCAQSMVQMAVRSDRPGRLRIEAVRVLDPVTKRVAGTASLRQPSRWEPTSGMYAPWDERVVAGADLQTSYKLGALDLSKANAPGGPSVNTYAGPFMLEVDISIDGRRQTVRSPEFGREEPDMVRT